jgi:hypothetical protein
VPAVGLQSDDFDRLVVRLFRSELASVNRQSRDVTREYDEVSASWFPRHLVSRRVSSSPHCVLNAAAVGWTCSGAATGC